MSYNGLSVAKEHRTRTVLYSKHRIQHLGLDLHDISRTSKLEEQLVRILVISGSVTQPDTRMVVLSQYIQFDGNSHADDQVAVETMYIGTKMSK